MRQRVNLRHVLAQGARLGLVGAALFFGACAPGEQAGSQTNWFRACRGSDECGELECLCGTCSLSCEGDNACVGIEGATCRGATASSTLTVCGGQPARVSMCLIECPAQPCPEGTQCSAGVCSAKALTDGTLILDPTTRFQSLVGFGASMSFSEDELVRHPAKRSVFDVLFGDSGFEILRLGNRFESGREGDLVAAQEIAREARTRIGDSLTIVMTSATPPASLKANSSRTCTGDDGMCTLARRADGGFDYAPFAEFWRESLEAYAAVGIQPSFVSLQNNPNWVPATSMTMDACRFLPTEGEISLEVDGEEQNFTYPGYDRAVEATAAVFASLPNAPVLIGPETSSLSSALAYSEDLGLPSLGAVAVHLYGSTPGALDLEVFSRVKELAEANDLPVFQTEMSAEGMDTAVLIHHAMTEAGASMYLQNDFISSAQSLDPNTRALVQLTNEGHTLLSPYNALMHFARFTDPGWVRLEARLDAGEALGSAWVAPDEDALTLVLINPSLETVRVELELGTLDRGFDQSRVVRTLFDGRETWLDLGEAPVNRVIELPRQSIVTIAYSN